MPNSSLPESLKKTVECANMEETQYVWNVAFRGEEEMWRGQTLGWQHLSLSRAAQTAPSLHSPSHTGTPLGERVMSNRVKKNPWCWKRINWVLNDVLYVVKQPLWGVGCSAAPGAVRPAGPSPLMLTWGSLHLMQTWAVSLGRDGVLKHCLTVCLRIVTPKSWHKRGMGYNYWFFVCSGLQWGIL